jgi:hypothetical protein
MGYPAGGDGINLLTMSKLLETLGFSVMRLLLVGVLIFGLGTLVWVTKKPRESARLKLRRRLSRQRYDPRVQAMGWRAKETFRTPDGTYGCTECIWSEFRRQANSRHHVT